MDFPHYGDPLAEIGHIGVSGHYLEKPVEVNVEGRARHISDALRRVLSSYSFFLKLIVIMCYLCEGR